MSRWKRRWIGRLDVARVEAALEAAERRCSAELRVSVAPLFWGSVERAAHRAFERLGMTRTEGRNGVLIFVVPSRRRFAFVGDRAVQERLGQGLWDEASAMLSRAFARGDYTAGLVDVIGALGERLSATFPPSGPPRNELPNQVSFE